MTLESKKQNSGNLAEDQVITDLYKIIENKRNALKRVASSELVTLFWNLGNELNEFFKKSPEPQTNRNIIYSISANLGKNYGSYFTTKNLVQVQQFSNHFPDFSILQEYIRFLSWEHILQIIRVKNHEARQFYLKLKIEQGLSVKNLQNAIAFMMHDQGFDTTIHEKGKTTRRKIAQKVSQISHLSLDLLNRNDRARPNPFKKPFFSVLSSISKPPRLTETSNNNFGLYKALCLHIEKFRDQQNRWLNANFNLLNWEIGNRLSQEISLTNEKIHNDPTIQKLAAQLQKYDKNFSNKQLNLMMKFAEQFPTLNIASVMSYSVGWEHIIILMDLHDKNDCLFYINTVNKKGLNANDPRKLISKNSIEHQINAEYQKKSFLSMKQGYKKKITLTKSGQPVITIGTIDFELTKEKMFIPNILENQYFQDFVAKK